MIDKINLLLNAQMNKPKKIYVLKGFNSIIDKLNLNCTHIFDLELFANIYNLDHCQEKLLNSSLQIPTFNQPLYCLYEEAYMVIKKGFLGLVQACKYSFVEIDIGIFETFYPGFPGQNNNSIVNDFEQDTTMSNPLQVVYSSCISINNSLAITYNEIDSDLIEEHTKLFRSYSTYIQPKSIENAKYIDLFDNSNYQLLVGVFNDLINGKYNSINYTNIEHNDCSSIFKFVAILNSLGINVIVKEQEKKTALPELYDTYLNILHRKNNRYSFYDIDMYQDPFSSNKKIPINQSVIIDTIYQNILKAQKGIYPRDIFVTAPTGAGKSILFQIPAIMAAEKNNLVTIIISPLIGLMNDQVDNIKTMTNCAATINSDFTPFEKEQIKESIKCGNTSILYISPESLLSNADIKSFIGDRKIGLLVIDEAHTVVTWGKNFRPDYWYLGDYLNKLRHNSNYIFPIATFTATATIGNNSEDMYHDIIDSLNMTPVAFIGDVKRKNIRFNIRTCIKDHAYQEEKENKVLMAINNYLHKNEKTLVYFPYVRTLNDIYNHLNATNIGKYYGGMDKTVKNETLDDIKIGTSNVILATKAFGMGIDVPDIKNVYHFAPTGNLADYVQEIGRAARKPELTGVASTDFFREDFRYINKLYGMSQITSYNIIGVLQKILYKYKQYGRRNFLVSTEEFAHVFVASDDSEIETKLKATILAIKKDFIKTTNYVPLIFKPKSMFTYGLFYIPDSKLDYIKKIGWNRYLEKKYDRHLLSKMATDGTGFKYSGDVYTLDFKKCWDENYNKLDNGCSFGSFKRKFYTANDKGINELGIDKNAFLDRMLLEVNIKKSEECFSTVCNKAYVFLDKIKDSLDDIRMSGKHFSIDELANIVLGKITTSFTKSKMCGILDPLINILINVNINTVFGKAKFCDYNSKTNKYNIVTSYYMRLIADIKNEIKTYFQDFLSEKKRITLIDSTKDANKKMRKNMLLVAIQILELFDLITYSLKNGDRPEFFIRVNSEKALQQVVDSKNYYSPTLEAIRNMHYSSVDYMQFFFENLTDDESRWNFIEDYFLGVDLYKKYQIPRNNTIKIKAIDDEKRAQKYHPLSNLSPNEHIRIYTICGDEDIEGKYYISNKTIDLSYPAKKLSKDCEVAKHLSNGRIGDVFVINEYEYMIENIEYHEI